MALFGSIAEQILFGFYDAQLYHRSRENQLRTIVEVIGTNSTSALAFHNQADAQDVLDSLRAAKRIRYAHLFDDAGKLVAAYAREGERPSAPPQILSEDKTYYTASDLVAFHRITLDGRYLGSISLTSDLTEIRERLRDRILVGILISVFIVLLATLLAFILQRFFTEPIQHLISVIRLVSQSRSSSLRARRSSDNEFGTLVDSFNSMLDEIAAQERQIARQVRQLETTNRELDQFVYAASHDLKAPLRAVDNLAMLIRRCTESVLPEDKKEYIDLMQSRVRRMESLIDDLLQYSRVGRISTPIEVVNTHQLVSDVVTLMSPPPTFRVVIGENLPEMRCSRAPLEQVFRNLIGNAIKHHDRRDGTIWVAARSIDDFIEFSVRDDGPGIPEQYHERIFQMFQTLKSRDEKEGSGMGLALVKKIVESQGGKVWVVSAGDRGATFLFTWPKQRKKEEA